TGFGMDDETLARIFDPFFTTKPIGRGTGLGLATVFGIVQQSGGHIAVESAPGVGSCFTIYFRAVGAGVDGVPAHTKPAESSLRGTETILLVEDDEHVRVVTRRFLRMHGYHVLEAPDGATGMR